MLKVFLSSSYVLISNKKHEENFYFKIARDTTPQSSSRSKNKSKIEILKIGEIPFQIGNNKR